LLYNLNLVLLPCTDALLPFRRHLKLSFHPLLSITTRYQIPSMPDLSITETCSLDSLKEYIILFMRRKEELDALYVPMNEVWVRRLRDPSYSRRKFRDVRLLATRRPYGEESAASRTTYTQDK